MYKLPGSAVSGVFSRNQEKALDFTTRHKIPKVYSSVDELLSVSGKQSFTKMLVSKKTFINPGVVLLLLRQSVE